MKHAKELYQALRNVLGNSDNIFPAIIKSVDKVKDVCDVVFNELEIGEVRLKSTVNDNTPGARFYPKIDSVVLIEKLGDKGEYFIVMSSELEEVNIKIGETVFKQNEDGFEISKNDDGLKELFADLLAAIKTITVPVISVGAASGLPINIAEFEALETRANALLQ